MSVTYYQTASAADSNSSGLTINALSTTVPGSGTVVLSVPLSSFADAYWATASTDPASGSTAAWPDGAAAQVDVASIGADLTLSSANSNMGRWTSNLSGVIGSSVTGTWSSTSGTGLKAWTQSASVHFGTAGNLTDRMVFDCFVSNGTMMGAESITFNVGSANDYVTAPWSAAATKSPPFALSDRLIRRNSLLRR